MFSTLVLNAKQWRKVIPRGQEMQLVANSSRISVHGCTAQEGNVHSARRKYSLWLSGTVPLQQVRELKQQKREISFPKRFYTLCLAVDNFPSVMKIRAYLTPVLLHLA